MAKAKTLLEAANRQTRATVRRAGLVSHVVLGAIMWKAWLVDSLFWFSSAGFVLVGLWMLLIWGAMEVEKAIKKLQAVKEPDDAQT